MMAWLERHLGRFAIPHLVRALVALQVAVFLLEQVQPSFVASLVLDPASILRGEVWRTFTFLFVPPTFSWIWLLLVLPFLWMMGDMLEGEWGAFRLNLYYLVGVLGVNIAAFVFGQPVFLGGLFHTSMFLAFATLFPDFVIRIYFILPVPAKILGWITAGGLIWQMTASDWVNRAAIGSMLLNYLLFFGPAFVRGRVDSAKTHARRARFDSAKLPAGTAFHTCHTCGATEVTQPHRTFRVASDGNEYCDEHLPR
jgi:membrane associated rhomboid family serine protease